MPFMISRSLALLAVAAALPAQQVHQAQQVQQEPTNNAPNSYQTIEGWAKLPEGRIWGSLSAVDVDKDGVSIWIAERCGANSCANSNLPPIMKFDSTGKLVKAFGAGMIQVPHGMHVDRDGNVWVTDAPFGRTVDSTRGHQVFKFSPDGKLLMTLGKPGGGRAPEYFYQPNDVITAPNGDIYVAEGHSDAPTANARILKFDRKGKFLRAWGTKGSGDGQVQQPHALAMDSRGRIFVADRSNNRILILDQDFNQLATWHQFSRPSGIYIDKNDVLYVADSESGSVEPEHKDWYRGIRIGSARDGSVTAFIPDPTMFVADSAKKVTGTSSAEGVAVDSRGNIYGAEVGQKALKRYVRKP